MKVAARNSKFDTTSTGSVRDEAETKTSPVREPCVSQPEELEVGPE